MATSLAIENKNPSNETHNPHCFSLHHTTPTIVQPNTLLVGQKIPVTQLELNKMGMESLKVSDSTFNNDFSTWIDLIRFGLEYKFVSEKSTTKFLQMKQQTKAQALKLNDIKSEFLNGLDCSLAQTKKNIFAQMALHNLVIEERLQKWGINQFCHEVTFSKGDEQSYGCNETLGLRLDARDGLSVLKISCLEQSPAPLQRIGGQLIYLLCYLAEKNQSQDLAYGCHSHHVFSELHDQISSKTAKKIVELNDDKKYAEVMDILHNSGSIDNEEIDSYFGDDIETASQSCAEFVDWWLGFEYMNAHFSLDATVNNTEEYLDSMQIALTRLSSEQNPAIGHPFYAHLVKLIAVLSLNIKHKKDKVAFLDCASDNYLNEYSMVSISQFDDEYLHESAENINSTCEFGSHLINLSKPNVVMDYFHNMILADSLLLAFDIG